MADMTEQEIELSRGWLLELAGPDSERIAATNQFCDLALAGRRARWVACSERLPDIDGVKWEVCAIDHYGIPYRTTEYYYFHEGWATDETVTHWRTIDPLPPPQKEER
jgi:hypothetical protein